MRLSMTACQLGVWCLSAVPVLLVSVVASLAAADADTASDRHDAAVAADVHHSADR